MKVVVLIDNEILNVSMCMPMVVGKEITIVTYGRDEKIMHEGIEIGLRKVENA